MTYWKVEMSQCFDISCWVVTTWHFKSESEANNFVERANKILRKSHAYDYYYICEPKPIEINNGSVEVELEKLEKRFENYF